MFEVVGAVSAPGRAGRANEDGFGTAGRFAWVIDGATGLGDEELIDGPSDAAWLTAEMGAAFRAFADEAEGPAALLSMAARACEARFLKARRRTPAERYEIPTAAVLVAASGPDGLEIAELGDCAIYIAAGGRVTRFGGTEAGRALEQQNARKMVVAGGGRSPEVLAFLRRVRNLANTPNGYPIFAPDARSADAVRQHRLPAPSGEALLLSDGYEAAVEDYGLFDGPALIAAARGDVRAPLEALRAVEAADPDCRRHPRFKQSDDATALLVRFGDVH